MEKLSAVGKNKKGGGRGEKGEGSKTNIQIHPTKEKGGRGEILRDFLPFLATTAFWEYSSGRKKNITFLYSDTGSNTKKPKNSNVVTRLRLHNICKSSNY